MKTAEEIIQEYRDRGYSLESLRILAESRGEPLGGRMLALLDEIESGAEGDAAPAAREESAMAEVPCETGTYSRVGDEVFFVADDEGAADGENVDFDVMAETVESVADIVVGETADIVSYRTEAVEPVEEVGPAAEMPAEETPEEQRPFFVEEEPAAEEPVFEENMSAEISADYIPGSVSVPFEPEAEPDVNAEAEAEAEAERKEQLRLARQEKRKARREKKKAAAEAKAEAEAAAEEEAEAAAEPEPENLPVVAEDVRPPMGEAMSIITPADIIAAMADAAPAKIAPETLTELTARSFALVAMLVGMSQAELAKVAEMETESGDAENREAENNVIRFAAPEPGYEEERENILSFVEDGVEEEEECFAPFLQILAAREDESVEETTEEVAEETTEEAAEEEQEEIVAESEPEPEAEIAPEEPEAGIVAETNGEPEAETAEAPEPEAEPEPTVPAAELEALLEKETALRLELENEYQTRLDTFASRLLEVQSAAAASETRVAEKKAELEARTAILEEMQNRLAAGEEKQKALLQKLDGAAAEIQSREDEIRGLNGLRDEHNRLYGEYEDLRKAYNEVVSDVMPALQTERDELAVTVERQCVRERTLRTSLKSSRKRLAAGYILGAAACLTLVTLPVANWLQSGDDDKRTALEHQMLSELRETLNIQTKQNVDAQTRIVELERKITRARDEITRLDGKNRELAGLAAGQHAPGIAVFDPGAGASSGTPTRAMTMALQATVPPNGALHVNEVMDPAGSIEQLAMANREQYSAEYGAQMAQGAPARAEPNVRVRSAGPLSVSAVARTDAGQGRNGSLRPSAPARTPEAAQASNTVTAKVRKGEGVAQVVYRVLNTRDPAVIDWVIAENKIRRDRRNNPVIQPDQELRLPANGHAGETASRSGARRR